MSSTYSFHEQAAALFEQLAIIVKWFCLRQPTEGLPPE